MEQQNTTTEISSAEIISNEIKKFNIADAAIKELSDKYLPLKINGIDDKDGYKKVVEGRKHIKKLRVGIDSKRKELNADAIKLQKAVNGEAKRITDMLTPIESHLEDQENWYESELEKIKMEKVRLEAEKLNNRTSLLLSHGMAFNGSEFTIAHLSVGSLQLKEFSDEGFDAFLEEVKSEYFKELDKKAEEERKKKEEEEEFEKERQRLEEQRKEQEAKEAALKAEEERIQREQEAREAELKAERERLAKEQEEKEAARIAELEMIAKEQAAKEAELKAQQEKLENDRIRFAEEARQQKLEFRKNQLMNLGYRGIDIDNIYWCLGEVTLNPNFDSSDEEWNEYMDQATSTAYLQKKAIAKQEQEKIEREREEAARKAQAEKEELERQEKIRLEREEALRPDKDKLLEFANEYLRQINVPIVNSPEANQILSTALAIIENAKNYIISELENLK